MSGITASLGPLKAIKGGRTPAHPDVRTPAHPDTLTPAHSEARTPERAHTRTPGHPDTRTPIPLPLQAAGKRSHPDFRKRTVFLRDTTWLKASRKWQDEGHNDFSELVEKLLQEYARER